MVLHTLERRRTGKIKGIINQLEPPDIIFQLVKAYACCLFAQVQLEEKHYSTGLRGGETA
jgi:hypothetical protein